MGDGPPGAAPDPPAWLDRSEYAFTSRAVELSDGARIHCVDQGSGPAILFVHGTPSWSFEWRHLVRALSPHHRCIAPDHLGFGLSDRPADAGYDPETHARRLAELVERLALRDVTLVVHDFGGIIGLPLAVDQTGLVGRLVVMNSWMWDLGDDPEVRRAGRLLGGRAGRFLYERVNLSLRVLMPGAFADRSRLTPALHRQYLAPFAEPRSRGLVLWPLARSLGEPSPHAERLWERRATLAGIPALIVWGMRDRALKPHHLERWREALPHAEVVRLGTGHWPQEEAPEEVTGALRTFLER